MGLVDDLNWKKKWAQANLEAELWDHLVSLPPEVRKHSITAERLAPQITVMHDHLQMDIKRVLYRMRGKPLFEYRFYAIARTIRTFCGRYERQPHKPRSLGFNSILG